MEVELYEEDASSRRQCGSPVRVVPDAAPGTNSMGGEAFCQSCNNKLCLPPKTMKAEVPVTIGE